MTTSFPHNPSFEKKQFPPKKLFCVFHQENPTLKTCINFLCLKPLIKNLNLFRNSTVHEPPIINLWMPGTATISFCNTYKLIMATLFEHYFSSRTNPSLCQSCQIVLQSLRLQEVCMHRPYANMAAGN